MSHQHRSGHFLSILFILFTTTFIASSASAVLLGNGTLVVELEPSGNFPSCATVTFSSLPVTLSGTDVNLGTDVQQLTCSSDGLGVSHCTSSIPGAFAFDLSADFICVPAGCMGMVSFIAPAFNNVSGSVPGSLGTANYTSDGSVSFMTFQGSPSINCGTTSGTVARYEGTLGINVFQPVSTPSGADVSVSSSATFYNSILGQSIDIDVNIGFASVGEPGQTLVTASSNSAAALSSNFAASVGGYQAAYLDISTTATIAPPITVCTTYSDTDNDGFIDGTSVDETSLRVLHGEGMPLTFVDRTVSQDVVNNQICAEVDSLSPFVTAVSLCGNGTIDGSETCDDGNGSGGDGCSSACQIEAGWQCAAPGSACIFVCGNSTLDAGETCDDGNAAAGDGCGATCQTESGWQCTTPGTACTFVCGNGIVDASEGCDDGNTTSGDGCSAQCQVEACHQCSGAPSTCTPQNGNPCDDGSACTTGDTCQSGSCVGSAVVCQPLGACFDAGTCNPSNGHCSNPAKTDGASCDSGDGCPGDVCQGSACQAVSCPVVDVEVVAPKPKNVTIGTKTTSVTKNLSVTVRNVDNVDRTISLAVDATACPMGVAGSPDFDAKNPGADTSILVPKGKTKTAKIPLTFDSTAFDSFNFKAPNRCALELTATAVVAGGSNDATPSNNVARVELSVIDKHDSEHTTGSGHETTIKSASPTVMTIADNKDSVSKTIKATIGNADYRPAAEVPGNAISLSASTTCAGLSLGDPVCDPPTSSATATVKGGKTKVCKVVATAHKGPITTSNKLSPQRCTVTLEAHGPDDPETAPRDVSNNATQLQIDILDKNDF